MWGIIEILFYTDFSDLGHLLRKPEMWNVVKKTDVASTMVANNVVSLSGARVVRV